MIFLILAILMSTGIVITFKLLEKYDIDNLQAITFNYVIAAGFGLLSYKGNITIGEIPYQQWFPHSIAIGIMFIVMFSVFALSAQKAGVAITSVSSKMSVVIPVMLGILIFGDSLSILKITGIILALSAFYLTFKKDKTIKVNKKYFFLPIILFFGNGFNDSMLSFTRKSFSMNSSEEAIILLNVIFSVSLIVGSAILAYQTIRNEKKIKGKSILAGIILGLLNFGSTYYFFRALSVFDNSVFFPIFNVSIVVMSALSGYVLFKEKLRPINWAGIALATIAITMISLSK